MPFFVIVSVIGLWILPGGRLAWLKQLPLLRALRMQTFLTFDRGRYATLVILLVALVVGLLAHVFGFHPAVGAYMAGLIVREEHFQRDAEGHDHTEQLVTKNVYERTKRIVDDAAFSWIGPVFFVDLGAKILFDRDLLMIVLPYAAVMTVGIATVQILSAGLAARYSGGMNRAESLMIGFGMLGRAELAFVVMDIAYVQHSIKPTEAFFTLMITAFVLNILVLITITWWRPHNLKLTSDEAAYDEPER